MERRNYPRINVSFPIKINPNIIGQTVDISETGLGFILERPLLLSKTAAKIELSKKESIKTEFKVIWNKQLVEKNGFKYGACFIKLKKKDISILRDVLIWSYIEPIIAGIQDPALKKKVLKFWTIDIKKYITHLDFLTETIKNNKMSLTEAYKKGTPVSDTILKKCDDLELLLDNKTLAKRMKEIFRLLCGPWAYRGTIVRHGYEKPRGYPGDYLMLEAIYNNRSSSEGIGYCCDMYFLNNKYAEAVRNRKDMMKNLLINYINNSPNSEINILNIACGPCREISEAFSSNMRVGKKVNFTLVDFDEEALLFSKRTLDLIKTKNLSFKYLEHNILCYPREHKKYSDILGNYDLVYSIGLADYLPDATLKRIISFCFNLLKLKGSLIFAHKDIAMYKPVATDWWCDWTFYSRDEKKLLNMISESNVNNFDIKVEREKSNVILFLTLTKKD